jgi:hypothetical protein
MAAEPRKAIATVERTIVRIIAFPPVYRGTNPRVKT